ncbi:MAG: diaminopimelate epimerase [Saprospiraceae bacterium]|jgi:diaminopimelate epimerase|nr:diaminopimelate epimerase [Saprospiraceae bacterium]MBK6814161.1 diaminopimelate epimerase [Saprospiraceae bacterium]MBK7437275.1 diaminopimelate epimerase [Saprospiraceae bacterium]MBL0111340.1 diaminopimelate epimerase [Saprospiraceae bacterium]MBP7923508.1 diaminopimelate epimerase [Saprospiraceae bacterium]
MIASGPYPKDSKTFLFLIKNSPYALKIPFYKYHGAGNDFVIIDNRSGEYDMIKDPHTIAALCHRRFGIGADGFMLIELGDQVDFTMVYHNADGGLGSLCGNGGRCIVALAHRLGIAKLHTRFKASDGIHEAKIISGDYIELKMSPVTVINLYGDHAVLDTGSPHYVQIVDGLEHYPVFDHGSRIRYGADFPQGINVNFIEPKEDDLFIRTYERGVEDETWACGTGATASALAYVEMVKKYDLHSIHLHAKGGPLKVKFNRLGPGHFEDIWLCGGAQYIFEGSFLI